MPSSIGKGLKYCDFKYYLHPQPAALVALGLASEEEVEVKGVKVKPMISSRRCFQSPGNAFLGEDPESSVTVTRTALLRSILRSKAEG